MNSILYLQKSMLKKFLIMDGFGPVQFGWISCVLVHPSRHSGPRQPTLVVTGRGLPWFAQLVVRNFGVMLCVPNGVV